MEVKILGPKAERTIVRILLSMVIFAVMSLTGCIKPPGRFETLSDFQQNFSERKMLAVISGDQKLTLKKAVETALCNNPTNQAAAQAVNAARYGYFRALSSYAPELNGGYSLGHTLSRGWDLKNPPVGVMKRNDHFVTGGSIQASWLLFDGFARELEAVIAHLEYKKSGVLEKNVQRLLERAVAYAFYDMYLAEEEIRIYTEDLDFQNSALVQEKERFRNGHVSKASVLNFQILAARAQSNIHNAVYRREVAFHALFALMGYERRKLPEKVKLHRVSGEELPQILDENFYLELAIKYRPDLEAEKIALNIAWRNKQKAYADFFPELKLFSEFTLETYHAGYGGYRVSGARSVQGGFTYGIEGKWNLFKGFDSFNKVRKEKAMERMAMWELNAKFLEVVTDVRDAHSNCKNAQIQIGIFQEMAQWVKEQRDLVYSEYCNGRQTITRLNEAQDMLVEAQSKLIVAIIEFSKAVAQLYAATGLRIQ